MFKAIKRIATYFQTKPTPASTRFFMYTFPIWALCTYGFMQSTGFFEIKTYPFTLSRLIIGLGVYLILPSTFEEALYRPIFFPTTLKLSSNTFIARTLISTAIFMVMHPITAYLFMPEELPVFSDWRFLTAVVFLGIYCSTLLVKTKTIYFGILTHYILVISWKFVFCGTYVGNN